jgi:hypothetical protein
VLGRLADDALVQAEQRVVLQVAERLDQPGVELGAGAQLQPS